MFTKNVLQRHLFQAELALALAHSAAKFSAWPGSSFPLPPPSVFLCAGLKRNQRRGAETE